MWPKITTCRHPPCSPTSALLADLGSRNLSQCWTQLISSNEYKVEPTCARSAAMGILVELPQGETGRAETGRSGQIDGQRTGRTLPARRTPGTSQRRAPGPLGNTTRPGISGEGTGARHPQGHAPGGLLDVDGGCQRRRRPTAGTARSLTASSPPTPSTVTLTSLNHLPLSGAASRTTAPASTTSGPLTPKHDPEDRTQRTRAAGRRPHRRTRSRCRHRSGRGARELRNVHAHGAARRSRGQRRRAQQARDTAPAAETDALKVVLGGQSHTALARTAPSSPKE